MIRNGAAHAEPVNAALVREQLISICYHHLAV